MSLRAPPFRREIWEDFLFLKLSPDLFFFSFILQFFSYVRDTFFCDVSVVGFSFLSEMWVFVL